MITTFTTKFKNKFGACIKKILKTLQILLRTYVYGYLRNVDQGLVVFYQQNFRALKRDVRGIICFVYKFISQKIFYRIHY